MPIIESFAVIGGDLRFAYLAGALAGDRYTVISAGLDDTAMPPCVTGCTSAVQALATADAVILPMPVSSDGVTLHAPFSHRRITLEALFCALKPNQTVFCGTPSQAVLQLATEKGIALHDYFAREEMALRNAVPTAEGAIQLAMEELPVTLADSRVLITGYGRIGKALARLLVAMGARVTVAARRCADRALAATHGCETIQFADIPTGGYDVIFNTVPHLVFSQDVLQTLPRETLLIDLASRPGGVDFNAAARLQIKTVWALSLPGRVAPKTAGEIIKDTVLNMIGEMA